MSETKRRLIPLLLFCVILLALLAGCVTPMQEVGRVVVAPTVQLPPVPSIVQTTEPKPPGYFQYMLLNYFKE